MFTWGWNQRGTLGHPPETKTENVPSKVKALSNVKIVQVLAFFDFEFEFELCEYVGELALSCFLFYGLVCVSGGYRWLALLGRR